LLRRPQVDHGRAHPAAELPGGDGDGLPSLLGEAESEAPGSGAMAGAASPALSDAAGLEGPVTAHVSDLSGQLSLFVQDRTIVVRDPALVARLLAAAR